jgi:hypothetical protein
MNALIVVLIGVLAAVNASPASKLKESVTASRSKMTKMLEKSATGSPKTKTAQNALRRHNAQSTTYFNVMIYEDTSCDSLEYEISYGTGMCFTVSLANPTASSGMFSYSNNVLTTMLYSDTACSTYTGNFTVANANGISQNTCTDGVEWSTSTSFSEPSSAGFSLNYFVSESTCTTATSPFYSSWTGYVGLDDDTIDDAIATLDDDIFNCLALPVDIDSLDDNTFDYAITSGTYYSTVFTSSSSGSSSKSSCFAGSETVELASGETIAISEVKMGDRVLGADANGNTKFSEVIAVPHARNAESAVFTHLETASGNDIKMTPEHLVMVSKACDSATELVQAGEVASGMCLMTTTGMDGVKSTSEVTSKGVYTVVLQDSEMVVVNGVVASPFAVNHATANAYYNVIRALPASVMSLPLLKQANLVFGSIVASMGF